MVGRGQGLEPLVRCRVLGSIALAEEVFLGVREQPLLIKYD
jgi:hypothetical protein